MCPALPHDRSGASEESLLRCGSDRNVINDKRRRLWGHDFHLFGGWCWSGYSRWRPPSTLGADKATARCPLRLSDISGTILDIERGQFRFKMLGVLFAIALYFLVFTFLKAQPIDIVNTGKFLGLPFDEFQLSQASA